jgi:hypothetical protein
MVISVASISSASTQQKERQVLQTSRLATSFAPPDCAKGLGGKQHVGLDGERLFDKLILRRGTFSRPNSPPP